MGLEIGVCNLPSVVFNYKMRYLSRNLKNAIAHVSDLMYVKYPAHVEIDPNKQYFPLVPADGFFWNPITIVANVFKK